MFTKICFSKFTNFSVSELEANVTTEWQISKAAFNS
jgi:hypothetical protein